MSAAGIVAASELTNELERVVTVDLSAIAQRNAARAARRLGERGEQLVGVYSDGGRCEAGVKEQLDCTVRASAIALCLTYKEAHAKLAALGRKPRSRVKYWGGIPESLGLETREDLCCMTVARALAGMKRGRFVVRIARHVFAVVDGVYYDETVIKPGARVRMVYENPAFRPAEVVA